jgi:hypothetical protein
VTGYLSRLANQSSLQIAGAPPVSSTPSSSLPSANASSVDVIEQTQEISPASVQSVSELNPTENHGAELQDASGESCDRNDQHAADTRAVSEQPAEIRRRAVEQPSGLPLFSGEGKETVREVLAWIAEEEYPAVGPIERDPSPAAVRVDPVAVSAETSGAPFLNAVGRTPPTAAAKVESDGYSVHIGAIHLTIEAPPEKLESRPIQAPPAAPTTTPAPQRSAPAPAGSRLRRHYLRSG